jgi:Nucleotidyltransferase domain
MTHPAGTDDATTRQLPVLRVRLLAELTEALRSDSTVQAVALVGSLGRGIADDWSDIDFMILMDDDQISRFADRSAGRSWVRAPLIVDSRQNAPAGCTQVNAVHLLEGLPFWVDYCVFPASATAWPIGCQVLFERQKVPTCGDTFDVLTSRGPRQPARQVTSEELRRKSLSFIPLTAKDIARGNSQHVRDMIRLIGSDPGYQDLEPSRQLDRLRAITGQLSDPSDRSWAWLTDAVTAYLDLVERSVAMAPAKPDYRNHGRLQ